MKKIKTLLIIIIAGLLISLTYTMVLSHSVFPPVESTGAPGESTCQSCHSSFALNSGTGNITVALDSTRYQDDSTYIVTVTVNDTTEKNYGFELTALNSSNAAAGTFTLINTANTYMQKGDVPIRYYVSQHNASSNDTWTFKWTAPASDSGNITFYACGVAGNDNGNSAGDEVYTTTLQVKFDTINDTTKDTTTALNVVQNGGDNKALAIYPVPATNSLNLYLQVTNSSPIAITLFDVNGKIISTWNFNSQPIGQFKQQLSLDAGTIQNGLYLLSVKTGQYVQTQKILIQNY